MGFNRASADCIKTLFSVPSACPAVPCEICNSNSAAHFTGVAPADRTGACPVAPEDGTGVPQAKQVVNIHPHYYIAKPEPLLLHFNWGKAPKGSLKNNFTFWMPMHPDWLRYENSKYA